MVPIGDEAQVEACFGLSNIVLILMQDRCTVCDERTIGSEIILDAPDETPRCKIGAHFAPNIPSALKSLWTH